MKKFFFVLVFSFLAFFAFSDNWTLGVMEFSFKQTQSRSESSSKAAAVLPQLIIDQFSNEELRTIPTVESLSRKLNELQTARLSLFLQLSKEYKSRDSLVLTTTKPKELQKAIKLQMEKIRAIETKIDENLREAQKAKDEAYPKIERERRIAEGKQNEEKKENEGFLSRLPFPFFARNEKEEIVTETVVLYKSDSTTLFTPTEKSLEAGFSSWSFQQEVTNAKINGLITGEITCYGDYCSVSASLRIYPGGQILGTVTEVGQLSDLMPLASSIARNLDSKIANALPVMLEFEIEPKEVAFSTKVIIDGVVLSLKKSDGSFDSRTLEESGIHHINIEAPGYESLAFTYSFTNDNHFNIHVNLVPKVHGLAKIRLKKYQDGVFQAYALLESSVSKENPWAELEVNGKSVLGVFRMPKTGEDDSVSNTMAFFRVPENKAFDGMNLLVNAKPFDRAANIDKRRRWMYTAYTALICSLPFTFYNLGEFTAENTAYSQGRGDYERLKDLQKRTNICSGVTAALGVWAVIELVRYLYAADQVLPVNAKVDKKAKFLTENPPSEIESEIINGESPTIQENEEILIKTE